MKYITILITALILMSCTGEELTTEEPNYLGEWMATEMLWVSQNFYNDSSWYEYDVPYSILTDYSVSLSLVTETTGIIKYNKNGNKIIRFDYAIEDSIFDITESYSTDKTPYFYNYLKSMRITSIDEFVMTAINAEDSDMKFTFIRAEQY